MMGKVYQINEDMRNDIIRLMRDYVSLLEVESDFDQKKKNEKINAMNIANKLALS
jgi:hypothetical protein